MNVKFWTRKKCNSFLNADLVFKFQNSKLKRYIHDLQLIMQKLLAIAVSTVMTKLMIVFKVSFFIALIF